MALRWRATKLLLRCSPTAGDSHQQNIMATELNPSDILTPEQLAARLQVSKSWVFEQTRNRAKIRNARPLPCIRLGKYIRFSWAQVSQWMLETKA
jgi:hypothetical protein